MSSEDSVVSAGDFILEVLEVSSLFAPSRTISYMALRALLYCRLSTLETTSALVSVEKDCCHGEDVVSELRLDFISSVL